MRRAAIGALALVVAGALWLSGSATIQLGERHNVPTAALPALVVVLEVAAVIGTTLWITAPARRARTKPALVVVGASAVAAVGGWQAYGWLGLVAPAATVLVTDMLAERWAGLGEESGDQRADRTRPVARPLPLAEDPQVIAPDGVVPVDEPTGELEVAEDLEDDPGEAPGEQRATDEDVRAWVAAQTVARGRPPGRDAVRAAFSIGSTRAQRLLDEAPTRPPLHVAGEGR